MTLSSRAGVATLAAVCIALGAAGWWYGHRVSQAERQSGPAASANKGTAAGKTASVDDKFNPIRPWDGLTPQNAPLRLPVLRQDYASWDRVLPGFYKHWGELDGPAAVRAAALEPGNRQFQAVRMVLAGWATKDEAAARAWLEQQPPGPQRLNQVRDFIRGHTPADMSQLAAWVTAKFAAEDRDGVLVRSLAGAWAKHDPAGGAQWLGSVPDAQRAAAAETLFVAWARSDAPESSRFLLEMPKGPLRDVSIAAFARGLAPQEPVAALAWAQEIEEEALRAGTVAVLEQVQPQAAGSEEPETPAGDDPGDSAEDASDPDAVPGDLAAPPEGGDAPEELPPGGVEPDPDAAPEDPGAAEDPE